MYVKFIQSTIKSIRSKKEDWALQKDLMKWHARHGELQDATEVLTRDFIKSTYKEAVYEADVWWIHKPWEGYTAEYMEELRRNIWSNMKRNDMEGVHQERGVCVHVSFP